MLKTLSSTIQIVSVVVGVVISILSFNYARIKDAETRKLEAAKPFLVLRQDLYKETAKTVGILANPEVHTAEEMTAARKRFRELYVAELSMVESRVVESGMVELAQTIDGDLRHLTPAQSKVLELAHKLRDSFVSTWDVAGR